MDRGYTTIAQAESSGRSNRIASGYSTFEFRKIPASESCSSRELSGTPLGIRARPDEISEIRKRSETVGPGQASMIGVALILSGEAPASSVGAPNTRLTVVTYQLSKPENESKLVTSG